MEQPILILVFVIAALLVAFLLIILIKQNRGEDFLAERSKRHKPKRKGMAIGMSIGIAIGMSLGTSMDNIAVGLGAGIAIGASIGLAMEKAFKKQEENRNFNGQAESLETTNPGKALIAGLVAVIIGILILGILMITKKA